MVFARQESAKVLQQVHRVTLLSVAMSMKLLVFSQTPVANCMPVDCIHAVCIVTCKISQNLLKAAAKVK